MSSQHILLDLEGQVQWLMFVEHVQFYLSMVKQVVQSSLHIKHQPPSPIPSPSVQTPRRRLSFFGGNNNNNNNNNNNGNEDGNNNNNDVPNGNGANNATTTTNNGSILEFMKTIEDMPLNI